MQTLNGCPFCGGRVELKLARASNTLYHFICQGDKCMSLENDGLFMAARIDELDDAIARFNQRPSKAG
jgi:hypothetical protein